MTTRTRTRSNHFAIPAAALLLHACATDESGCEMPPVTGAAVYVSAQCGAVDGDGSKERPLSTLAAAVAKAKPGTTIAVAAGTYAETVSLPSGVTLTGMGASQVIIAPPADVGIRVAGAELTTIAGVTVQGARGTGIEVKGGKLLLQAVAVKDTLFDASGKGGNGIELAGVQWSRVERTSSSKNKGCGLITQGSGEVVIIDPLYAPSPRLSADTGAIIDPLYMPTSTFEGNGAGGVAIIDPLYAPNSQGVTQQSPIKLEATLLYNNVGFGLGLFGAGATVTRSAIHGTVKGAQGEHGDGIVIAAGKLADAPTSVVAIDAESVVGGNARGGLLVAAKAQVDVGADIATNGLGGLWAQGSNIDVVLGKSARVRANSLVGAAATMGARLTLAGATVKATAARKYADPAGGQVEEVGDGVGVFDGGRLSLDQVTLADNARAGVMVHAAGNKSDGAPDVSIVGASFVGGKFGIAVNKVGATAEVDWKKSNNFKGVATDVEPAGKFAVQTTVCSEKDGKKCVPQM